MQDGVRQLLGLFWSRESLDRFAETLEMNGSSWNSFLAQGIAAGFGLSIALTAIGAVQGIKVLYITFLAFACFPLPMCLLWLGHLYLFELSKRKKESMVPDCLLQASTFPKGTELTKILSYLSGDDFGALGKEFGAAESAIRKGATIKSALQEMSRRNKSGPISRAVSLLLLGHETGADMGSFLREAASDLLETNSILMERNATLVVEKATLLFAGGLIVPAVLGLIASLISGFSLDAFESLGFGSPAPERAELLSTVLLASKIYIGEYAIIASLFIANQEGNQKKALVYAAFLLPCSLATYFIASGIPI